MKYFTELQCVVAVVIVLCASLILSACGVQEPPKSAPEASESPYTASEDPHLRYKTLVPSPKDIGTNCEYFLMSTSDDPYYGYYIEGATEEDYNTLCDTLSDNNFPDVQLKMDSTFLAFTKDGSIGVQVFYYAGNDTGTIKPNITLAVADKDTLTGETAKGE